MRAICSKIPMGTKLAVLAAIIVTAAFVLRDDSILGSFVIVVLVALAASVHFWRQESFPSPASPSHPQSNPKRNVLRGPIWLFIVEWLFIAAAAHYVTNDFDMPYGRLTKCIFSGFDCCRFSLWG